MNTIKILSELLNSLGSRVVCPYTLMQPDFCFQTRPLKGIQDYGILSIFLNVCEKQCICVLICIIAFIIITHVLYLTYETHTDA